MLRSGTDSQGGGRNASRVGRYAARERRYVKGEGEGRRRWAGMMRAASVIRVACERRALCATAAQPSVGRGPKRRQFRQSPRPAQPPPAVQLLNGIPAKWALGGPPSSACVSSLQTAVGGALSVHGQGDRQEVAQSHPISHCRRPAPPNACSSAPALSGWRLSRKPLGQGACPRQGSARRRLGPRRLAKSVTLVSHWPPAGCG